MSLDVCFLVLIILRSIAVARYLVYLETPFLMLHFACLEHDLN